MSKGCGPGEALRLIDRQLDEFENPCRFIAEFVQHARLILVEYGHHRLAVGSRISRCRPGVSGEIRPVKIV